MSQENENKESEKLIKEQENLPNFDEEDIQVQESGPDLDELLGQVRFRQSVRSGATVELGPKGGSKKGF